MKKMSIIVVSLLTVLFSCNTQNEADQEIKLDKAAALHQGAFAFEIWFNRPAPLAVMRQALLAH